LDNECSQFLDQRKQPKMQWLLDPHIGDRRGAYRGLVGRCEGKGPLRRPRHRWDDNIKVDLEEVGCGGMALIKLAQDRETGGGAVMW